MLSDETFMRVRNLNCVFVSGPVPLGYKLPVGQLFTEPSFFDDTDQILAELTCELDEQYLQLSSEVTPRKSNPMPEPRLTKEKMIIQALLFQTDLNFNLFRIDFLPDIFEGGKGTMNFFRSFGSNTR